MWTILLFGSRSAVASEGGEGQGPGGIATDNVKLWLKADSIGQADGSAVSTWADSGPLGMDASQATASLQPTYETNVLNSQPCVRFDSTDDVLSTAALDLSDTPTISVFSVWSAPATLGRIIYESSNIADNNVGAFSMERRNTTFDVRVRHRGNGGATVPMFVADDITHTTTPHYVTVIHDFTQAAGNEITYYRDGTDVTALGTKVNTSTNNTDTGFGNYAINIGNRGTGGVPSGADIFELIILKGSDSTERSTVHTYLATKYGL